MSRALCSAATVAALIAATPVQGQGAPASAAGTATATIVRPLAIRQIADLDFGIVASTGTAGSVTLGPGVSALRYDGGARQGCAGDGECPLPHFASFELGGEANRSYKIALPSSVAVAGEALLSAARPGETATPSRVWVDGLQVRTASRPGTGPAGQLDPDGRDRFDLGGTLRIAGDLPPARYRVSIPVVVTYN